MRLKTPSMPFEPLPVHGESITIDVDATNLVIPTGNQNVLPSFNEFTQNPNRVTTAPCGGLKDSITQDKFPGALSIEGEGCYLQTTDGNYTGKTIGAGKLSETSSIVDSGTTGIEFATADGVIFRTGDGVPFLIRPPSCIVEEFKVINISNVSATYTIIVQCPDSVDSIEVYNTDTGWTLNTHFTKVGNSYTFSRAIDRNSFEQLQLTIKYQSLAHTHSFSDDANTTIGLENMTESWIALIPTTGHDVDFIHFSERPKQLSYKQESDGTITQITIYPGNGILYHGQITHPDHTRVSGSGYVPDCLNKNMHGSITKFLQSHGMRTDFPSDVTITTWVVPAISDTKILPLSTISDEYLGDQINIRASPGEYTSASFVLRSDADINLKIESSDLTCGENLISSENIDIKSVNCWCQGGYTNASYTVSGRFLTPELLVHNDSLIVSTDDINSPSYLNSNGKNYLKLDTSEYIDISTGNADKVGNDIVPIADRQFSDTDKLESVRLTKTYNKQLWITLHIPDTSTYGDYKTHITLKRGNTVINQLYLNVTVVPITLLPAPVEYSIYYRGKLTTSGSISSEFKTVEQYTAEMINLAQHGITNPTIYGQIGAPLTNLDEVLTIRSQYGLLKDNLYFASLNIDSLDADITNAMSIASAYGVKQLYVYGYDEQNLNTEDTRNKISAVHTLGVKVFCGECYDEYVTNIADILDFVADSTLNPSTAKSTLYHSYSSFDGEKHNIYLANVPVSIPEYPRMYRQNYGLWIWQNDYDGTMTYVYQHSFWDIWDDFDSSEFRDHVFAYPTANGVIDTVQWEGYREGVNDMRYLATLQDAVTNAKNRGVATTDIDSWLATLKSTDLSIVDLDEIRSQIIDYILQLQSSENYRAVLMTDGNPYLFTNGQQFFVRE